MNKKIVVATAAAALICANGTVFGADIMRSSPYLSAPAPMSAYSWVGPYAGVNLGYQWASATHTDANPNGFAGGLQGGYNWQMGQFVYGFETDLQASGSDDTFASWKFSNPWFGTLRGRAGYAMNNVLLYATLGLAYGGGKVEMGGFSESNTHVGWAAGGGIEVGLSPNWSAKAEYLYVDLTDQRYVLFGNNTGFESNILRFGVNYRF
jgi:outer membrane immunogenic protein